MSDHPASKTMCKHGWWKHSCGECAAEATHPGALAELERLLNLGETGDALGLIQRMRVEPASKEQLLNELVDAARSESIVGVGFADYASKCAEADRRRSRTREASAAVLAVMRADVPPKASQTQWRVAPGDPTCVFTGDLAKPIKCMSNERAALVVAAVNAYRPAPTKEPPSDALTPQERHALWNCVEAARNGFAWTDPTGRNLLKELYERTAPTKDVRHVAQHEETGRMWWGPKDQIPNGYADLGIDTQLDPDETNEGRSFICPGCQKTIDPTQSPFCPKHEQLPESEPAETGAPLDHG